MKGRLNELRYKEIIDVRDGSRFGYVGDLEVDWSEGRVKALVVPGRLRLFAPLGREEVVIPMEAVRRFGEDIILIDGDRLPHGRHGRRREGRGREPSGRDRF